MRSIQLLKNIIRTPHIFGSEYDLQVAKNNLHKKMQRRDRQVVKRVQIKLFEPTLMSVLGDANKKDIPVSVTILVLKKMNKEGLTAEECMEMIGSGANEKNFFRKLRGKKLVSPKLLKRSGLTKWYVTKNCRTLLADYK